MPNEVSARRALIYQQKDSPVHIGQKANSQLMATITKATQHSIPASVLLLQQTHLRSQTQSVWTRH